MPKTRKKSYKTKKSNLKNLLFFFIMLPIVALTVFIMLQPQSIRQFAQTVNAPALFGCLHTGQADPTLCGTRMGEEGKNSLMVNGRPFVGQIVYYGDTVSGSFTYKNVGDEPINVRNYGIAAGSTKKYYIQVFQPLLGALTLAPGKELSASNLSYRFGTGDPNLGWVVGPGITNTDGQPLPIKDSVTNIRVSAVCTALRIKQLTTTDKSNIKALCSKDPKNTLCTSRQYCELFGNGTCSQPVLGKEISEQQCDENIVLDQKEQDVLESLCKVYPDSDACKDFCKRTIGSKLCPAVVMWFDKNTGKQVFPQPAKYLASSEQPAVAAAQTGPGGTSISANATYCDTAGNNQCVGQGTCQPNGSARSGICSGAPAPPAPANPKINPFPPKPAGPGVDKRSSQGYKPSCPSHRGNDIGQCCASDFPLINGCCQPGCFVYYSAPLTRGNCPYKNKSGVCCTQSSVEKFGYCQPGQVPVGSKPLPGDSAIPRDTNKIYPPNYTPPVDTGGGAPGAGEIPVPAAPAPNPLPDNPPAVSDVPCSVGDLNSVDDYNCLGKQNGYRPTFGTCMVPIVEKSQACYENCRNGPVDPTNGFKKLDQQCVITNRCQTDYDAGKLACE